MQIPDNEFRRILLQNSAIWLNTLDNDAKITSWNKAAENISGYLQSEVLHRDDIWHLLYPDEKYRKSILKKAHKVIKENKELTDFESVITTKDGSRKTLSWNTHQIKDADDNVIGSMAIARDITKLAEHERELEFITCELEQSNKQLREMSYTDRLTNIPSRVAYEEKIKSLINTSKRVKKELSLLVIDIDNFKKYNDKYGNIKGDIVLFDVSNTIKSKLHRKTDFIARYGPDEIVVLLPFTPINEAEKIATKMLKAISRLNIKHETSTCSKVVTVSIGITSSKAGFDDLLEHANKALSKAKENGRNRYEIVYQF